MLLNCEINNNTMFDPPITAAADIFIIITVGLIAIGAAIAAVDVYKNSIPKKNTPNKK